MSQLINQKFLQGIDSSKFKIAANGALMAVDSNGNLVEILKLSPQNAALVLGVEVASKAALEALVEELASQVESFNEGLSDLDGRISPLEAAMPTKAGISYVNTQDGLTLEAAKIYADEKMAELVNGAPGVLDTLKEIADALGNDANLAGTLSGQISSVQSGLANEISRATAAESQALADAKSYTDQKVSDEASARSSADDAKLAEAKSYTDQKVSDEASARASADDAKLAEAKSYTDSEILEEKTARESADSAMQSDMDDLDVYAQDIRSDLDQEILDRQSAISAEQSARQAAISAEQSARESAISAEQSARESAISSEQSARQSADQALDSRVTALEGKTDGPNFKYKTMTIGDNANDLQYIELDFQAKENGVMAVSLDRLMLVPGIDFSVSNVGGKTRLTWINDLVSPDGDQSVELGDFVFVSYAV
jgi:hypothetical protein